ncbi:TPA: replication protein, partial [Enterococcus faecium]|nr:replication protein [Enterococcus faecium]
MANENQLSEIQSKIEGRGAEKRTTINQLEKLNRISNRRLNVQNLNTPLKLQWSIDRITIVGKLKENIYYHTQNDVLILDFEQLMRLNENNGYVK